MRLVGVSKVGIDEGGQFTMATPKASSRKEKKTYSLGIKSSLSWIPLSLQDNFIDSNKPVVIF